MKLDSFLDQLYDDLGWRKKEVSDLFGLSQTHDLEILRKSLLLILYSHWEGFIKNSSKEYLKYVGSLKIELNKLTLNYKTIAMKGLISECYKTNDSLTLSSELKFMEKFIQKDSTKFKLENKYLLDKDKSLINTHDNLSPDVFINFCNIIGISEKDSIKTKRNYLDEFFLNNRNAISHGSKVDTQDSNEFNLTIESISKLKDIIFKIMDQFHDDLQEYASGCFYLNEFSELKNEYDLSSNAKLLKSLE